MSFEVSHLPHPLAVLRIRAENEKSPRGRHDAAYLLWEAGLRLLAAVLLAEFRAKSAPCPNLIQPLGGLRRPSTGHWRAIVRELLPVLSAESNDPGLTAVARSLDPKQTIHDMPQAALLAQAIATKLRPNRATQPQQTVRIANLFDDMVAYRHEVRAHGGLGDDKFFDRMSGLMLAGLDAIFAHVDVLCGRKLVRSDQSESSYVVSGHIPDSSVKKGLSDFTELTINSDDTSLSLSPWLYWNEFHREISFFNGFGGGHQKQALYLTYVSGAKTRQSSLSVVELIGELHEKASSTSTDKLAAPQWIPDFDQAETGLDETPIKQIGDYKILEVIGKGGMGVVYRAYQPSLQRIVAMKVMRNPHDSVAVARFDREIQSLAKVDHPNLVKIYDSGTCDDDYFYTMELVEGVTISSWLEDSESDQDDDLQPYRQIATLMIQVAEATEDLNCNGVIHRDIKPANIMVNATGDRAVLLDLGLATQVNSDSDLTLTHQFVGTLRYSSPEQANNETIDARSDVYSLGATLWELLADQKMLGNSTSLSPLEALKAVSESKIKSPTEIKASVPSELSLITLKCLEKRPENRYQSAVAVAEDLRSWLKGQPVLGRKKKRSRPMLFVKKFQTLFGISAIGLGVLFLLVPYLAGHFNGQAENERAVQTQLSPDDSHQPIKDATSKIEPGKVIGISPSKKFIVSKTSEFDDHQIIELKTGKVTANFSALSGSGLGWNNDETKLMIAGKSGQMVCVSVFATSGELLHRWHSEFGLVEMSPAGDRILVRGLPRKMTDLAGNTIESFVSPKESFRGWANGESSPWTPDGSKFAFYDEAASNVLVYSKDGGDPIKTIKVDRPGFYRFRWLRSGTEFASLNRIYDFEGNSRATAKSEGHDIVFNPDETRFAFSDGTIYQLTGRLIRTNEFFEDSFIFWDQPDVITSVDPLQPGRFREFNARGEMLREVAP